MPIKKITILTLSVLFLYSCSKVPFSDRKQMNLLPESELVSMSLTSYKQFLSENPALPAGDPNTDMVKRVGLNIQNAVVRYMTQNKMGSRIAGYKWEFNLVKSDEINAWCMPGGKVVVYSGLLGVTQDEPSLAIVMGHEIAHAIARHGNERMSQQLLTQAGGVALNVAIAQKPEQTKAIFNTAYGAGTTVGVLLPFSRLHETEADKLGLIFAAMAGYDPHAAPAFWQRMSAKSGGAKPPEILSTHPSDQTRIKNLNAFMPQAMKYYKK
jgi:predicted Zn-dependent protease